MIPKRVLMTADTLGGVWTYAIELTHALQPHGVEVALATMGAPLSPDQANQARSLSNLEIFESQIKLEWMDDPWSDVDRAGYWLLQLEEHLRPDVIHLNGFVHGALPWFAPVLVAGHSCVLSWWQAVNGCAAPERFAQYRNAVAMGLKSADAVVAPTEAMLEALSEHYGPLPVSHAIANCRSASFFSRGTKHPFVFAAGRIWDAAKNISLLEDVAVDLAWPVYVAGEASHPRGGHNAIKNVRRLGQLPAAELSAWLARASIYALPARYEPFGLSVLEAALSGCALVLGDIPSLRENWENAALFVDTNDPESLRVAIQQLAADRHLRMTYADRAYVRAQDFTPQRMANAYLQLYAQLTATKRNQLQEVSSCAS
jgi:glycogen synthase